MDFYWPSSPGEWLAFASALVTIAFGLLLFFAPRRSLALLRLEARPDRPEAIGEARSTMAGFYIGVGLTAILFDQPFTWMALGAGWAFTALGRLVSILVDRGFTAYNGLSIVLEIVLAGLPLSLAFGYL